MIYVEVGFGFALAMASTGDLVQPEKSNNANRQVNDIFKEVHSAMLSNCATPFSRDLWSATKNLGHFLPTQRKVEKIEQGNQVYGCYGTPLKLIAPGGCSARSSERGQELFRRTGIRQG